jgi:hypothetical protein
MPTHESTETRETDQPLTLLERMGGVSGLTYASIPSIAYVVANAIAGLDAAVVVAVGASVGLIVLRMVRKEPVQPAVSGLVGVAIAALIAYQTGSAENFFLPGIWFSLLAALAFAVSIVVRRPLVGVIWHALTHHASGEPSWRTDAKSVRDFDIATLTFVALFLSRFVVQQWLYDLGSTGWLAFARIGMGYPLLALALMVAYWAGRRARRRLELLGP